MLHIVYRAAVTLFSPYIGNTCSNSFYQSNNFWIYYVTIDHVTMEPEDIFVSMEPEDIFVTMEPEDIFVNVEPYPGRHDDLHHLNDQN